MPTVDVGLSLAEDWYPENYAFACVLAFEQFRTSFSQIQVMDVYGPGADEGENLGEGKLGDRFPIEQPEMHLSAGLEYHRLGV